MRHAVIGSNIMDRLVKCPGSLVPGQGSLAVYDRQAKARGKKDRYVKNRIECHPSVILGQKIDELAKSYICYRCGLPETKRVYIKGKDEMNPNIMKPASDYFYHVYKSKNLFAKVEVDPVYDMSKYMPNLPTCEFRVLFNPDVVLHNDYTGLVFISDLTTGQSDARNKMFQVLCCAVGIITNHPEVTACMCEVYNAVTSRVELSKFSREELEAYRDDIIVPTLNKVRSALDAEDIEEYRSHCSWCDHFCKCKDSGCQTCHSVDAYVENDVPIQLKFFDGMLSAEDKEAVAKMLA